MTPVSPESGDKDMVWTGYLLAMAFS
jgi:hypothetical protein